MINLFTDSRLAMLQVIFYLNYLSFIDEKTEAHTK